MGKHSKGKHAAGSKASAKASEEASKKSASASEDAQSSAEEAQVEVTEEVAEDDALTDASEDAVEDDADLSGAAPAGEGDAASIAAAVPLQADEQTYSPEIAVPKSRKGLKIAGIVLGIIIGVLLIVYLAGAWLFSTRFLPNTSIVGIDFSLKTPAEMQQTLADKVGEYSFSVTGQGLNFKVDAEDADLNIDQEDLAQVLLANTNPWQWPVEIFKSRDETETFTNSLSASKLGAIVNEQVAKVNETAEGPQNAYVAFSERKQAFVVEPEQIGTMLEADAVLDSILAGAMALDPKIVLTKDVLVQPTILSDDKRLKEEADEANELVGKGLSLKMDDFDVVELTPSTIASWITFSPEFEVGLDDEALKAWAGEIAEQCNTVGSLRNYTRADGKNISVSGGVYGWEIDGDALIEQVSTAILGGESSTAALEGGSPTVEIPVIQSGTGFDGLGGRDWGNRYVDVDLSEQFARMYDDDGNVIWSANIVSGAPNGRATPTGVWKVNSMASPSTLIGAMTSAGVPEYKTEVKYWMPFQGNAIGFHDATWQAAFGGNRYREGFGSHGCINLSYNDAGALYGILRVGDVVVTHY